MSERVVKQSYTVPCASAFRDAVEDLARRRRVNVGDLARSVFLVLPAEDIARYPDPGEPGANDRETVVLKSGAAAGRPWRRKPRLQVRMPPGHDIGFIRRALAIALDADAGRVAVRLEGLDAPGAAKPSSSPQAAAPEPDADPEPELDLGDDPVHPAGAQALAEVHEEVERLRAMVNILAFDPLPQGVRTRDEALHVLGFPPGRIPDRHTIRNKFRLLAMIHHPDGLQGSHERMSQLNAAMEILRREGY